MRSSASALGPTVSAISWRTANPFEHSVASFDYFTNIPRSTYLLTASHSAFPSTNTQTVESPLSACPNPLSAAHGVADTHQTLLAPNPFVRSARTPGPTGNARPPDRYSVPKLARIREPRRQIFLDP